MSSEQNTEQFAPINRGYNTVFKPGRLSLGLVAPLDNHHNNAVPSLQQHVQRIQLAESLGFSAIWLRDVPFNVPSFGDAGQIFDPFVYLGLLAAQTHDIALGVASVVLPLRHPAHVAKAAASADALSDGRLLLGVASGDRPDEYPALNMRFADRGERFRESYDYIRQMAATRASFDNAYGQLRGDIDMLPKPMGGKLPLLITGASQQNPDWLARHGDGWMTYPRDSETQGRLITQWRANRRAAGSPDRPAMQSLYIDLVDDPDSPAVPIHLGFRSGSQYLLRYLNELQQIGINHVALNLRFNHSAVEHTLEILAEQVLPAFHTEH